MFSRSARPQGTSNPGQDRIDWRIVAHLVREQPKRGGGPSVIDLFPELLQCVDGACVFMSRLVEAVGSLRGYEQGDFVFLTGKCQTVLSVAGHQSVEAAPFSRPTNCLRGKPLDTTTA